MDTRIQFRISSDLKQTAKGALPEGMTLSCLFALVEAMQASLNKQAERLAWLQQAVASLSEHLLCEPPPRPVGAATDGQNLGTSWALSDENERKTVFL